jgi:hypothetical protein
MVNNIDRADWAAETLQQFADLTSLGQIDEDTISDLICDLGHYAEIELKISKAEIIALFGVGIGAWLAESEDPLGEPTFNKRVIITVEE